MDNNCKKCCKEVYNENKDRRLEEKRRYYNSNKEVIKVRRALYNTMRRATYATRAHDAVRGAIERGILVRPSTCSRCGISCKPDGHHEDYDKQLEVVWLCKKCHGQIKHNNTGE